MLKFVFDLTVLKDKASCKPSKMFWFLFLIAAFSFCEAEKSKCEIIRDQSSSHGLIGAYIPQCSADGSFEKVQCWSSTGYCWCVNEEGHEVTGSKIRGTPDCSDEKIKSKCEMIRDHSNVQGLIGAYIPQCAADGSFKMMQCWGSTGYCWCVDRKGREVTGTKIRGTPDCNVHSTRSKCEQMRLEAVEQRPMVGKYIPQCRKDGSFDPVQCWPSTGYCWCVDKQGQRLVGTEVQFKRPVC